MQNRSVPKRKYRPRSTEKSIRFNLTMSPELLKRVDAAAKQDYTTRSELIRMALLWYIRPQGRALDQTDPTVILKTLKHRHARTKMKEMTKDINIFND